jgi:DNA polymerase III subunit alpha, Gram-positive type
MNSKRNSLRIIDFKRYLKKNLSNKHSSTRQPIKTFLNKRQRNAIMDIVVVDIETTGLSRERHAITEIAAIKVRNGVIIDEFKTLVNPMHPIPSFITKLTGITNDMVLDAPKIRDVMPQFVSFCENAIFVGHNASFDYGFLSHNAMCCNLTFEPKIICTRRLANRLCVDLPSKKLSALCEYFQVTNIQAHRAMADAQATYHIFEHMRNNLAQSGIVDIDDILRFSLCSPAQTSKLLLQSKKSSENI